MAASHQLLLLTLCAFFLLVFSQEGFTSLDCGGSSSYKEKGISWISDEGLISSGTNATLKDSSLPKYLKTLRYFTANGSHCYILNATINRRHLLRASFYYGNYDNKSLWPSFQLEIDGVFWQNVSGSLQENSSSYSVYEAIVSSQGSNISVCLSSSNPSNVPFISALESRLLPAGNYSYNETGNNPLYLKYRQDLGAKSNVRYSDDPYDRIWYAQPNPPAKTTAVTFSANKVKIALGGIGDDPPIKVLETGFEGASDKSALNYSLDLGSSQSTYYINLYFSDFRSSRSSKDICMFTVFVKLNGYSLNDSTVLEKQSAAFYTAWVPYGEEGSSQILDVSILPTSNSTLAPVLSAVEVYSVGSSINSTSPTASSPPPKKSDATSIKHKAVVISLITILLEFCLAIIV